MLSQLSHSIRTVARDPPRGAPYAFLRVTHPTVVVRGKRRQIGHFVTAPGEAGQGRCRGRCPVGGVHCQCGDTTLTCRSAITRSSWRNPNTSPILRPVSSDRRHPRSIRPGRGCLVVLYAQPLGRVIALTTERVGHARVGATLRLGSDRVLTSLTSRNPSTPSCSPSQTAAPRNSRAAIGPMAVPRPSCRTTYQRRRAGKPTPRSRESHRNALGWQRSIS